MADKKQTKLSKKVMDTIENDDIQMYSKTYFRVLHLSLIAVAGLFIILTTIMLALAIRDINYGHDLGFREYGTRGYSQFLITLPWLALLFGLLTFLIAMTLIKKFDFTYKHRLVTVAGALVFAVAGLSLIFVGTGIEAAISKTAPFKSLHTFGRYAEEHAVSGEVVYIEEELITILSTEGEKVEIVPSEGAIRFVRNIKVGDMIFAIGEYEDGRFEAFGIKRGNKPTPPHIRGTFFKILK